jgi:hypothetical protein
MVGNAVTILDPPICAVLGAASVLAARKGIILWPTINQVLAGTVILAPAGCCTKAPELDVKLLVLSLDSPL